jgi:hypothetical protein
MPDISIVGKFNPGVVWPLLHNGLPDLWEQGQHGWTISASVRSTGEQEPATGTMAAIPDGAGARWLMGTLTRWVLYGPGEGDGVFAGYHAPVGGLQLKVDTADFNISFPTQQTVDGTAFGTQVFGTGSDGTEYGISVEAVHI